MWGTSFDSEIFIPYHRFETLEELAIEIKSVECDMQDVRERLFMYAMGGISAMPSKDSEGNYCNSKVDLLHKEVKELLNYYDELSEKLHDLELLNNKEVFEKRVND